MTSTLSYAALEVHGNLVRWIEAGAAEQSQNRPVAVFVHGIASRASQSEQVMCELAKTSHVIAPDLLGHGQSAKPRGDYSLGAHACGIRDLLSALGHDRVTVVGHSLGGGVAMQFAYQFPERVQRLALVDAGGLGREVSPFLRAATLPGAEFVLPVIASSWVRRAGLAAGSLLRRTGVQVNPGTAEALHGFATLGDRATREAFVHTARAVLDVRGQRIDARDRLYLAADLPLLVVWGAKDSIIPVQHGRALAELVPSARLEVFERSGHFPHLTEPTRLARLLQQWLEDTEPAALDPETLTARLREPVGKPVSAVTAYE